MRLGIYAVLTSLMLLLLFDYKGTKDDLKAANKSLSSLESTLQISRIMESGRVEWKKEVVRIKDETIERITPHKQELRRLGNEAIKKGDGSDDLNPDIVRVLKDYNDSARPE